jgi:phosphoglycerol geranylgeranyltransferase
MNRPDVVVAHALAGQYLGMNLIYLEAGSGAKEPVAPGVVEAVNDAVDVPLIVGGGIRSPETASETVKAGASIIVTGTIIEIHSNRMKELADAVHWKE